VSASKFVEIAQSIRDVVSAHHGLALSVVCLLKTRSIPKTTSGKIARAWCRRGLQEDSLDVLYRRDGESSDADLEEESLPESNQTGYQPVSSDENSTVPSPQSAEEVRALPLSDILKQLEVLLLQVASQGPTPLSTPLDPSAPVSTMGLDSMTLVQFKGVLEKRYGGQLLLTELLADDWTTRYICRFHADVPDEFLFTSSACLNQLAIVVQNGQLTEEQKLELEIACLSNDYDDINPNADSPIMRSLEVALMNLP